MQKNINNNKRENLDVIELDLVNNLMMTSAITQPSPSPQYCTNLLEKKICMSDLYTSHRQFVITPEERFWYQ